MLPKIPSDLLNLYHPISLWELFYLKSRWRLCPYDLIESLLPEKGNFLDFGCGYGILANFLAFKNPFRFVVGIDLNEKRIRVAERSVKNRRNIAFNYCDIEELEKTPFDALVITDVLHHISDIDITLLFQKIIPRLSDNGILLILDVDRTPFWKFCLAYSIDRLLNPKSHLQYRFMKDMEKLLEKFPLKIEGIIKAHKDLPLSDVIYLCRKVPSPR